MRQFQRIFCFLFAATLMGAEVRPDRRFWAFDGPVHAMVATNGTAYVGGEFWYVGPTNGAIGTIDLATNETPAGWPYVVGGQIYAAIPDNNGGWFVGGSFLLAPEMKSSITASSRRIEYAHA